MNIVRVTYGVGTSIFDVTETAKNLGKFQVLNSLFGDPAPWLKKTLDVYGDGYRLVFSFSEMQMVDLSGHQFRAISLDEKQEARRIDSGIPKIGFVCSTYGTPAYVHLQLESLERFSNGCPVAIHDDCSPEFSILSELAFSYGAAMLSPKSHLGFYPGDLSAFMLGLQWAKSIGCDVLVKMSRTFFWKTEWMPSFINLVRDSCLATYGSRCDSFAFPIRTQVIGLWVEIWVNKIYRMQHYLDGRTAGIYHIENLMHTICQEIYEENIHKKLGCKHGEKHRVGKCYEEWPDLETAIFHKSNVQAGQRNTSPHEFAAIAQSWGLPYTDADFPHHCFHK